jgi:hypothetical protein
MMFAGRLITGFGTATMNVAQSTIIAVWFKGRELAFAFGCSYIADFSEQFQGSMQAHYLDKFESEPIKIVAYGLFFGFLVCLVSVLGAIVVVVMDAIADKKDKVQAKISEDEKFHCADLLELGRPLWLLIAADFCQEITMYTFISVISDPMLVIKYGFTEAEAARLIFLPYTLSPFICIPMGYLIDRTGRRVLFSK